MWLAPLLTGVVVAGIALFSLWLSDRRKLRREDQRQWDADLKASYSAIAAEVRRVRTELGLVRPGNEGTKALIHVTSESLAVVSDHIRLFELIASRPVIEASQAVNSFILNVWQRVVFDSDDVEADFAWAYKDYLNIEGLLDRLQYRVREALRI